MATGMMNFMMKGLSPLNHTQQNMNKALAHAISAKSHRSKGRLDELLDALLDEDVPAEPYEVDSQLAKSPVHSWNRGKYYEWQTCLLEEFDNWPVELVSKWLKLQHFGEHTDLFRQHDVDGVVLVQIEENGSHKNQYKLIFECQICTRQWEFRNWER